MSAELETDPQTLAADLGGVDLSQEFDEQQPSSGPFDRLKNTTPDPPIDEVDGLRFGRKYAPKYAHRSLLKLTAGGDGGTPAWLDLGMAGGNAVFALYVKYFGDESSGSDDAGEDEQTSPTRVQTQ